MSHYDKRLAIAGKIAKRKFRHSMMRGINLISLTPPAPRFEFGSVEGDWRAVGSDMRRAMQRIRAE